MKVLKYLNLDTTSVRCITRTFFCPSVQIWWDIIEVFWLCKRFVYLKLTNIYKSFMFFVLNSIHKDKSFHCDVCNVCLDKRLEGKHKCRPDSGHDECCICLEVGEDLLFFTKKTWLHIHPRQLCICWIAKLVLLLILHEVDKGGRNKWPLGTKSCFVDMVEHQWCSTASSFRFL